MTCKRSTPAIIEGYHLGPSPTYELLLKSHINRNWNWLVFITM